IRDYKVTGVQTCALPILPPTTTTRRCASVIEHRLVIVVGGITYGGPNPRQLVEGVLAEDLRDLRLKVFHLVVFQNHGVAAGQDRSEERRVGKGWGVRRVG